MKNLIQTYPGPTSQLKAKKAVKRIYNWAEQNYPHLTETKITRLIVECLLEMTAEKRYLERNN